MLAVDESVRAAIREGGNSDEIRTLARQNGMKLMQEYALEHVRDGLTTLEEVQRVVPFAPVDTIFLAAVANFPGLFVLPALRQKKRWRQIRKRQSPPPVPEGAVNE